MRLVYAILAIIIGSTVAFVGCEPQPEIFAMKKERIDMDTKKTTYYTNGMLSSEAISTRNNGIDDVWKFYVDGKVVRIDEDLNFDGVVDKSRSFDHETGELLITKIDANFDGTFELIEEYDHMEDLGEEKLQRKQENENLEAEEDVIITESTKTIVRQEPNQPIVIEEVNTEDRMIEVEPTPPAQANTSTIIIEEDEFPRSRPANSGSYFEPLEVNPGTGSVTPARNSRIVPAPVFTHPSDSLEE